MTINIRTKGATGEREVCKLLNGIVGTVMQELGYTDEDIELAQRVVQRNQNQTAVGGCDLSNAFGISFEIKRQEQLSVGTWWKQCVSQAERNNELPVLMYRQNRRPWKVRTYANLYVPDSELGYRPMQQVVELEQAAFTEWFAQWVKGKLQCGYDFRI